MQRRMPRLQQGQEGVVQLLHQEVQQKVLLRLLLQLFFRTPHEPPNLLWHLRQLCRQ